MRASAFILMKHLRNAIQTNKHTFEQRYVRMYAKWTDFYTHVCMFVTALWIYINKFSTNGVCACLCVHKKYTFKVGLHRFGIFHSVFFFTRRKPYP